MTMVTHGNTMKKMSGNLITRSNYGTKNYNIPCQSRPSAMQHNIHRGTDGKLRVLCGPKIRDENKYVQVLGVHNNIIQPMTSKEPEPEEVQPMFRTPPGWIRIGAILISLEQGVCMQSQKCMHTYKIVN